MQGQHDLGFDARLRFSQAIIACPKLEAGRGSDAVKLGEPVVDALLPVEIAVKVRDAGSLEARADQLEAVRAHGLPRGVPLVLERLQACLDRLYDEQRKGGR